MSLNKAREQHKKEVEVAEMQRESEKMPDCRAEDQLKLHAHKLMRLGLTNRIVDDSDSKPADFD